MGMWSEDSTSNHFSGAGNFNTQLANVNEFGETSPNFNGSDYIVLGIGELVDFRQFEPFSDYVCKRNFIP